MALSLQRQSVLFYNAVAVTEALPVNKPETTAMVIIARWNGFCTPHLAILRTADDMPLAIAICFAVIG